MMRNSLNLFVVLMAIYLAGCTGVKSFGPKAQAGDTVALGLGWQTELTSQNVTVTVTDSSSASVTYLPGDPAIRAIFHSYPDPVSKLIVGAESGQGSLEGSLAGTATTLIDAAITGGDKDYAQTFMVLDLPVEMAPGLPMATGPATITVGDALGNPIPNPSIYTAEIIPIQVEILPGTASANTFPTQEGILVTPYLRTMERASHFTVTLQGATIPYAADLQFTHDPDVDNSGVGRAYVVNPRGDLKNISWSDDGTNLKVILMPARGQTLADIQQFKFYVAGGITNLQVIGITGYDIDGNVVPGVTAQVN